MRNSDTYMHVDPGDPVEMGFLYDGFLSLRIGDRSQPRLILQGPVDAIFDLIVDVYQQLSEVRSRSAHPTAHHPQAAHCGRCDLDGAA